MYCTKDRSSTTVFEFNSVLYCKVTVAGASATADYEVVYTRTFGTWKFYFKTDQIFEKLTPSPES